ncbi:hypothetical protein BX666DRAFT_1475749 [Dichotomocladium elegans]|nr:hypothetical protein BX666DRAFT_1475749 [Dichotomocladium elegans]
MDKWDEKFNAEIVDTFCFRWPAFRCYVLVRVLDASIALFPVQSRRAFLYFHHAPLPHPPGPTRPSFRRSESRVQSMFQSWKYALALADSLHEESNECSDSNDQNDGTLPRERTSSVTLADVIHETYSRLRHGWIHAPCIARPDPESRTALILESPRNVLLLKARSPVERQIFLNLVKLQKRAGSSTIDRVTDEEEKEAAAEEEEEEREAEEDANTPLHKMSSSQLIRFYRNECRHVYDCLRRLGQQISQDETKVKSYCELFEKLASDWDTLRNSVTSFVLSDDGSQEQLRETIECQLRKTLDGYSQLSNRMNVLHARIQANPDAVGAVRLKFTLDRMKCKPTWLRSYLFVVE